MSVVSTRHNVNLFIAGKSEPLAGQRLAKVGYKPTKKNPAKYKNVCVSIPVIDVKETITDFTPWFPHIRALMETAQDGIIRSLYESAAGQLSSVSDEEIGQSAMLAWLDSQAAGGRLTIAAIGAWFDSDLKESLTVQVAEKLGFELETPEQLETVARHVNGYRELFAGLASGKNAYQKKQVRGLLRALELAENESDMAENLEKKLNAMLVRAPVADLLEL